MSDIVNAFKQTKGYKKRKNLLSDTQEVAQQPQEQESQNQALNASQQQNIALDTSGTKDSDRLAQLQQLAAAETAQNEANKQAAAQANAQAQQQANKPQQLSKEAQNVYNNAHNDMGWKKYYDEEKQKVRDSAFKNDGFGSWLQDVFNAGWDSRLAEQQARNRYASEMINNAWDDNGNVKDQNAVYQAQGTAAYNVDRGRQLNEIERANSRALGASYDSDFNPFEATANAIRRMDLGNAILQGDESDAAGIGKFLINLVPGMLSAPITGGTNISEAISGQGLDSETGKRKDLDGLERLGRGLSGAIDAAGVFYGGSGEAISSISNQIFKKGATEAAKTVAKQTSKQVMKDFAKAMLQEGTEEAVQQAFEFFGDGGKIVTEDGEFDGEAFKELAKQVAQAGGLGALGGGIFHGVSLGTNAIGSNLNNRKIKAQNSGIGTNLNTDTNTNLNTDTNQDLNVGDTDTNLGDTDFNENDNISDTNQNIEQQAKDVSTETNTTITPTEMTQNADASARVVEKSDALRDILNDSQKQAFNDRVKEIRSDLEQNKISYTEYLQKVEALQNEFTQQVEGAEVQQQEQSATGQQVNPEDVSNIVEGAEGTQASEATTKQTTPVEQFSETNNEATNTQPEMTEGMAQTEGVDPLERVYDNARQRYQEALQSGDRGAIEAARERYNQALEIKVRQDAIEFTDYDYNNGIKINDVLAQKMFNDGYDSARTLADQMFDITEGNVPLAYDYGTGTPLYMYEDIVAAMKKYGGKDAIGNQFQTSRAILNERNNAQNQAFRQAIDESIAQSEQTEPVIDQAFDDRVADEYGRQEMTGEVYGGEPTTDMINDMIAEAAAADRGFTAPDNNVRTTEQVTPATEQVAPDTRYAKLQSEYAEKLDNTGMTPELRRKIYAERYAAKNEGRTPDLNSVLNDAEQDIAKRYFHEKAEGNAELATEMYNSAYMTAQNEGTEYATRALTEVLDTGKLSDIYQNYQGLVTPDNYDASGMADVDYMIRKNNPELMIQDSADAFVQDIAPTATPEQKASASQDVGDTIKELNNKAKEGTDNGISDKDVKSMKPADKLSEAGKKLGIQREQNNSVPKGFSDYEKLKSLKQWDSGARFADMQNVSALAQNTAENVDAMIQGYENLSDKAKKEILSHRKQLEAHFTESTGSAEMGTYLANMSMIKDAWTQNVMNYATKVEFTNKGAKNLMNEYVARYLLKDRYEQSVVQKVGSAIQRVMNSSFRGARVQTTLNEIPEIFTSMADYGTLKTASIRPSQAQAIKAKYGMSNGGNYEQFLNTLPKADRKIIQTQLDNARTTNEQISILKQAAQKVGKALDTADGATQWNGFIQDWKDATFLQNAERYYSQQGLSGTELTNRVLDDFYQRMLPMSRVFKYIKSDAGVTKPILMYLDSSARLTMKAARGAVGSNMVGVNANMGRMHRIARNAAFDLAPRAVSALVMGVPLASVIGMFNIGGGDYSGIDDEDKNFTDQVVNFFGQLSPLLSLAAYGYNQGRQEEIAKAKGQDIENLKGDAGKRTLDNILKTFTPLGNRLDQDYGIYGNINSTFGNLDGIDPEEFEKRLENSNMSDEEKEKARQQNLANLGVLRRGYGENKQGRVQYLSPDNPIDMVNAIISGANRTSEAREYNKNPDLLSALINQARGKDYNGDGNTDGGINDFFRYNQALNEFPLDLGLKDENDYNRPLNQYENSDYSGKVQEALQKGDRKTAQEWYEKGRAYNALLDNLRVKNPDAADVYYASMGNNLVSPEKWKTVLYGQNPNGEPDLTVWNLMKDMALKRGEDFGTPVDPAYTQLDDEQTRRYLQYKSTATGEDTALKKIMTQDPFWKEFFNKQKEYYASLPESEYDDSGKTARVQEWNDWNDQYSDYMSFISGNLDGMNDQQLGLSLSLQFPLMAEYQSLKTALQSKYGDEYKNSQEYKNFWKQNYDAYSAESDAFNGQMLYIINQMRRIEGYDDLTLDELETINDIGKDSGSNKNSGYSKRGGGSSGDGGYSYAPYFENTFQAAPVYASVPKAGKMRYNPAGRANFNKVPMSGTMGGQPYAAV